jgi:hypothetical protein
MTAIVGKADFEAKEKVPEIVSKWFAGISIF